MKKILVIALVALLCCPIISFAQSKPSAAEADFVTAYDSYVRRTMDELADVPAIAIVVIKDDRPIFVRAYGMADKEAGVKADTDTMFYIASSTKAFTALAAAMLDREGKIRFSDPAVKYATGIQFKNGFPEKITIRDLLTHTSGLRNDALVNRLAVTGQIAPQDIARVFADGTTFVDANFGKYRYTNLGYNVYGILLEHTLKKRWQDLLQERIFAPAGMRHTTAYISKARAKRWAVAAPYIIDETGKMVRSVVAKTDNNMQSAGGMFMSISDLGKWLNLNMNDGRLNGKQVMPAQLIRQAHTGYTKTVREAPPFSGDGEYGLGWQIGKYKNEKVIYHHGGFSGYRSHVSFLPEKKIAVGILVNNDQVGGRMADMLATYAYDRFLGVENLEANYVKQLQDFADAYQKRKQQINAAFVERSKRQWQLSKPFAGYAGKYTNDLFGTIEIVASENSLTVRMGNLNTVATPYTEKDTIRVVMLPGGNGEVIGFATDAAGKPASLTFNGVTFTRVAT